MRRPSRDKNRKEEDARGQKNFMDMGIDQILKKAAIEMERLGKGEREPTPPLVQKAAVNADSDLMSSLLKRVRLLERHLEDKKMEVKEKSVLIFDLQKRVKFLEECTTISEGELSMAEKLKVYFF